MKQFSLKGQLALVTGAARGNGRAIALGLAEAGAKVVVADLALDDCRHVSEAIREQGGESWAYALDVADASLCQRVAAQVREEAGAISILVNNAGVLLPTPFTAADASEKWHKTLSVNVNGPFNVTQAFLPALRESRGCIVNLASIQSFVAAPTSFAYAASKGAVAQLTRTLAAELAAEGIRVNAVAPGLIETAMSESSRKNPERMQAFFAHLPMRRTAQPEELVGPVVFLASPAASYVTGVVLPVDGGYLTL